MHIFHIFRKRMVTIFLALIYLFWILKPERDMEECLSERTIVHGASIIYMYIYYVLIHSHSLFSEHDERLVFWIL